MKHPRLLAAFLALMALALMASPAQAILTSGTASPAQLSVPAQAPASRSLTWTVIYAGNTGPATVRSAQAVLLLDGQALQVINTPLSRTAINIANILTFTFPETLAIPQAVVMQAIKTGGTLVLRRVFTEDNSAFTRTVDVPVQILSSLTGALSVTRIDLSFRDGSSACSAKDGRLPQAVARIESAGTGLLRGEWQLREGGPLGSFRTLRMVQAPLSSATAARVESPELTLAPGTRYDIRLRVREPALGFTEPVLSCTSPSGQNGMLGHRNAGRDAAVLAPPPSSPLDDATLVKWKAVPAAKAYRIDVLAGDDGEPIASQMAKGSAQETRLSPLTLDKLDRKTRYTIRVVAQP